jgi:hypothetical protein
LEQAFGGLVLSRLCARKSERIQGDVVMRIVAKDLLIEACGLGNSPGLMHLHRLLQESL